jgi:hypothetical protein
MKRQSQELIEQAYNRGYKAGYDKAFATLNENWQLVTSEAEEKGRNEAWEAAMKICSDEGLTLDEVNTIFRHRHVGTIFLEYSASEAIEKLKEYEEKKEISIGDEVITSGGTKFIVLHLYGDRKAFDGLYVNGAGADTKLDISRVIKTGRTFPQIAEVLKKLKEGE